jgi:antitoxin (DNA-binding transcriptional repressor) of toxin-antitoxin stability system
MNSARRASFGRPVHPIVRPARPLSRAERGEEILITKRNKPVAVLSPYRPPLMTPEREKAIQHAIHVMEQGLPWGRTLRRFRREEMHER